MRSSLLLTGLIVICAIVWTSRSQAARSQASFARSGWFQVLWGDGQGANPQTRLKYFLVDDQGEWTELKLDDKSAVPLGRLLAFDRKRVRITGEQVSALEGGIKVRGVTLERPLLAETRAPGTNAIIGTKNWVTILCRFADSASTTPKPVSYFQNLMANTYPGMDHYWSEASYGNINLAGSVVVGWYNLPRPRSYYVYGATPHFDFDRAVADATAVADAEVYFPDFYGINFIFNQELDGFSWGGGAAVSKDGLFNQVFGATYLPPSGFANQSRMAHEMGHGFGLPHSSGPYSATYDSQWDPMSSLGTCSPPSANYGCIGVHTISYHKDKLGWIPAGRKYFATGTATINIERLGQPLSSNNYLMAQIPIIGSVSRFYTIEARLFVGYDSQLPGQAIVIHDVDPSRGDRAAQVVDVDNNGDPNDAGAMWLPGEVFSDATHNIQVTVNSMSASSFSVTIASPCVYSISPLNGSFLSSGGNGNFGVTTVGGCPWQASSNVDWVAITPEASGLGNGTVSYSVTANTGIAARTGMISIAGQLFTVVQAPSPQPPFLLIDETSGRAAALDSVEFLRDPFSLLNTSNFSLDRRTRVTLFAVNVDLLPGEDISVVSAQAEYALRSYPLTVEFVGKVPNFDWLTQIVVKLPDALANAGDVQVSINLRGVPSNRVLVRTQ